MSTPGTGGPPHCYRHPGRETYIACQRCQRPICPDCMVPAAVGFQCPDCIKQGSKSVRTPRTSYGGSIAANPQATTFVLIAINVAVWIGVMATGGQFGSVCSALALLPEDSVGPEGLIRGVSGGAYWQLITSAFTHITPLHIGFNMLALYVLGPQLEMVLGRARFLALYFISALAGSATVMWLSAEHGQTLGASGAIFGLMGGLLVVALKARANVQQLMMWIGLNLVITFVAGANISWQGHIGGLVGGALVAAILAYAPRQQRTLVQTAGISAVAVLLAVAVVVRAVTLA